MSSQQQPRPWFRLASMMRPTAPPPTPAPPPRPPPPSTALQLPPLRLPFRPPFIAPPQLTTTPSQQTPPPPPPVVSPPLPPNPPRSQSTLPATPAQLPSRLNSPSGPRSPVTSSPAPRSPVPRTPVISSPVSKSPPSADESPFQRESDNPQSPITTNSAPLPFSDSNARPIVSPVSAPSPSPKQNAGLTATAPRPSPRLPSSATKTLIPSRSAPQTPPHPSSPATRNAGTTLTTDSSHASPFRYKPTVSSPEKIEEWDQENPPYRSPLRSRPPSPLTLPPPAQLKPDDSANYLEPIPAEAQQKTVLTQNKFLEKSQKISNTSSHSPGNIHSYNKQGGGGMEGKKDTTTVLSKNSNSSSSSEDDQFDMRIITLAGENKGSIMELNHRHGPSGKKSTGTTNKDEYSGKNEFRKMQAQPQTEAPVNAFVNSNVQEINNSILYNCAYTNRSPGVHLTVSRTAKPSYGLGDK